MGVGGVPLPGGLEDGVESGELRGPGEFAADFVGAGNEERRIAGAARGVERGNRFAGDAGGGGDDLADAGAGADAEVVDVRSGGIERLQDLKMGDGEIVDVDEVADAGAVGSGIVGAVDWDRASGAQRAAQKRGGQMSFRIVVFAVAVPGASGVEVTQHGVAQTVDAVKPVEHDFGVKFGLAVGICGTFGCGFGDGSGIGDAENGTTGRKNKFLHAVNEASFDESESGGSIVAEIFCGVLHGFGDFGEGGEMHDRVELICGEEPR